MPFKYNPLTGKLDYYESSTAIPVVVDFVEGETPSGTLNGTNAVFTTAYSFASGSTRLFLNGIRLKPGISNDYTETGANQITFTSAPQSTDTLLIDYRK